MSIDLPLKSELLVGAVILVAILIFIAGMASEHQSAAMPLHQLIVVFFGILAITSIFGGIYAIFVKAESVTELSILGARLKTGHVGVAFVGIGLIFFFFTIRAVLKSQKDLAGLPP